MKYILRIPMSDQYSYTEVICDTVEEYNKAKTLYQTFKQIPSNVPNLPPTEGLDKKNLMKLISWEILRLERMGITPIYSQKDLFNIIRMSLARIKNKSEQ